MRALMLDTRETRMNEPHVLPLMELVRKQRERQTYQASLMSTQMTVA